MLNCPCKGQRTTLGRSPYLPPIFDTGSFLFIAMNSRLAGPLDSLLPMSHNGHEDSRCLQCWVCLLPGFWGSELRLLDLHGN